VAVGEGLSEPDVEVVRQLRIHHRVGERRVCDDEVDRTVDHSLIEIQRRLGHRKPDTTLRIYAHEWKYRDAQRSTIGAQLGRLFENGAANAPPLARVRQLAVTPSAGELSP
jgi:hypothetical protein